MSKPAKTQNKSIFKEGFTGLYPVPKTLRFELRPVDADGNEKDFDEVLNKLINTDKGLQQDIVIMKEVLNKLHRGFIKSRLGKVKVKKQDLKDLFKNHKEYKRGFEQLKKNDKYKNKNLEEKKKAKENLPSFKKMYGKGKGNRDILKEIKSSIEKTLKAKDDEYKEGFETLIKIINLKGKLLNNRTVQFTKEQKSITENFKFYGALSDYANNRKNYYTNENKSTEIIHRIVNTNLLEKYISNIVLFEEDESSYKSIIKGYENLFRIENYTNYLLQEDISKYNTCIGEINKKVNEENQKRKARANTTQPKSKHKRLGFFKEMYKQIGSAEMQKQKYDILVIEDERHLLEVVKSVQEKIDKYIKESKSIFDKLIKGIKEEPSDYFISRRKISSLSFNILGNWNFFRGLLGKKEFLSFEEIKEYLTDSEIGMDDIKKNTFLSKQTWFNDKKDIFNLFVDSIENIFSVSINGGTVKKYSKDDKKYVGQKVDSIKRVQEEFNGQVNILKEKLEKRETFKSGNEKKKMVDGIQDMIFRLVEIDRFMRNFEIQEELQNHEISGEDSEFYNKLHDKFLFSDDFPKWHKILDSLRNYFTKNGLDSVGKIRLWFGKPRLLEKQSDLGAVFLLCGENKYLAIARKGLQLRKFFDVTNSNKSKYQLLKTTQLDWRTLCAGYLKKYGEHFKVKSGPKIMLKRMKEYMKTLKKYPDLMSVVDNDSISSTEDLKVEIEKIFTKLYSLDIQYSNEEFNCAVNQNNIFLFKITSRDLRGTGKKDSQSIFFDYLFSAENLKNPLIKLGGNSMVFFRRHAENLMIDKKEQIETKAKKRKMIFKKDGTKIFHKERFYQDKMFIHFPIELNVGTDKLDSNNKVLETIKNNQKDIKVLGIDRGENNLLYYYLLDKNGKGEGKTLNEINGVNYKDLLEERGKERKKAQQKWSAKIPDIKNLKKGYLSWALREITDIAIKENAIIVLEGLNKGFIGGRRHIEKNVYSQFQKGLIDKLNFLMMNDNPREALQLTPVVKSYSDIDEGDNKGILFFVMPSYTSVTCPKCGWRKRSRIDYKSIKKAIKDFESIRIEWEEKQSRFKFSFTIDKVEDKIYSDVDRYYYDKEKHKNIKKDTQEITDKLVDLFKKHKVNINQEINKQIKHFDKRENKLFWNTLIYHFNLISNIRNKTGDGDDFILCPSCHFDTRSNKGKLSNGNLIKNGDSNGAYNIARRGLMLVDKIVASKGTSKPNLSLKLTDWDKYVKDK